MPRRAADVHFLAQAVDAATRSALRGGGPFAALVVRGGEVLARGTNRVTARNDPTAHAEVVAVRRACRRLGTFRLTGCTVYASAEPCPMCLGALYWARPDRVVFAATREDAARAGFDDAFIYAQIARPPARRRIPFLRRPVPDPTAPFRAWEANPRRTPY